MVSLKSGKTCDALEPNSSQDLISNLPDIAIDKILKRLPLWTVARMSILSRRWRQIWLSHRYLVFDEDSWNYVREGYHDDELFTWNVARYNCGISNTLFHHVGSVHEFYVYIPDSSDYYCLSGWLSKFSKVGVKKISIVVESGHPSMPWYIFDCKDLVKLNLEFVTLYRPPSHFKGFSHLRSLELFNIKFKHGDVLTSFVRNCPKLTVLKLERWRGMPDLVIDMPSVEHLTIDGDFHTLAFKNIRSLRFLWLYFYKLHHDVVKGGDEAIEMLANSCQLQELRFGGWMCEVIGAGCITVSPTFIFLQIVKLTELDLTLSEHFYFTLGMVQCCPNIKDLYIRLLGFPKGLGIDHEFDHNKKCELRHLVKVKITELTGSKSELQLIEYIFSVASKLEKLEYKSTCNRLHWVSELKLTQDLAELPRASPKAELVCLDGHRVNCW